MGEGATYVLPPIWAVSAEADFREGKPVAKRVRGRHTYS